MISAEQRDRRRNHVCSSDSAAIFGISPYATIANVWLDKTGQDPGFEGNDATDVGNLLEPAILTWAARSLPPFERDLMRVHPGGILAANFDGIGEDFVVEAKWRADGDQFGAEGTDEIPDDIIVQVTHAMCVAGPRYREAHVAVWSPGYRGIERRHYRVPRNEDIVAAVLSEGHRFWTNHVQPRVRPDDYRPSVDVLKRLRREPGSWADDVDPALVDRWQELRAARLAAEKVEDEAERAVLTALGSAEGALLRDGRTLTYMETTRKGYAVESKTYRTLRIKAAGKTRGA